jgi:hypothetical protein
MTSVPLQVTLQGVNEAVSGGCVLPYTILSKLAKAAVGASYGVFYFSDGLG